MKTVAHLDQIVEIDPHFYNYLGKYVFDKHNTGVYFQPIPSFPIEGYSTIDHKEAEEMGYFKVDFLTT